MVTVKDGLVAGFESPPSPLLCISFGGPKWLGYHLTSQGALVGSSPELDCTQPHPSSATYLVRSSRTVTRSRAMSYLNKWFNTKKTPQSAPIPGTSQVANSAGGFAFAVDDWTRLDRFLILGSEGGSYYATERTLTRDNAQAVLRCLQLDGRRVVSRIVEISDQGRAPKNDPALFALALAAKLGDVDTRRAAFAALPRVA